MGSENAPTWIHAANTDGPVGMSACDICGEELSDDTESLHYNCGGTCRWCMAKSGDPDCRGSVVSFMIDDCISQMQATVEEFETEICKVDYDVGLFHTRILEGFRP